MIPHYKLFKNFFQSCESKNSTPSFDLFITQHQEYIRSHYDKQDVLEYSNWVSWFNKSAKEYGIDVSKGTAKKTWMTYVTGVPDASKPSIKRSLYTANITEAIDGLSKIKSTKKIVFEEVDVEEALADYAKKSIEHFKSQDAIKSETADFNKLLILQHILVLEKIGNINLNDKLNSQFLGRLKISLQKDKYGAPQRIRLALKNEIRDAFEAFEDYFDVDELISKLKKMNDDAQSKLEERILNTMIQLLNQMTLKKTNRGEMRLQSNIVPAICSIFKVSIAHAPQGCDHVIFKDYSHVKNCRPDYLVEVQEGEDFINAVGEIKCSSTAPKKVALDKYRLALFGVSMLWSFNLKNSMVFQVVGQQMKFYLCSQVGEIMLMLEVGSLVLPLTYEEYANFYTCIDHLYNVALLYEKHCGKNDEEAKKWELLDFDVVKSLFAISTSKTSTVNNEASSSTGDCL